MGLGLVGGGLVMVVRSAISALFSAWMSGRQRWGNGGMRMVFVRDRWCDMGVGGH